ncbi:hypothetical protein QVD17_17965 [Tagetes erecta]|uniref:Cysteine-rich receptor-like protein kinase 10 n=1 Tax=Tagetes erecta TaxID=13708 RepID=A0AAD8KH95_TARER|nr:hypothetical protein QVD17_17965 [Tagetes erecta]
MKSKLTLKSLHILFFYTICSLNTLILAQVPDFFSRYCNPDFNYTTNDSFETNLEGALARLPNTNSGYGFFNSSFGQNPDTAYAIALCRGDTDLGSCQSCVNNSIVKIRETCPNQMEASGYYDNCMIYYSNYNTLGDYNMNTFVLEYMVINATNAAGLFGDVLRLLLGNLTFEAASGGELKYASGTFPRSKGSVIYGVVQCTPDLSDVQCSGCLNLAVAQLLGDCCHIKMGVRMLSPKCNIRYEDYLFYEDVRFSLPVPHAQSPIVGMETVSVQSLRYDLKTIEIATNCFSQDNKIGRGGFGHVYKGVLTNGQEVAVKRLSATSSQGVEEFVNEAVLMAKLQHRNLVRLIGFCHESKEKILIYEYVPNKSLDYFLFDSAKHGHLDWATRWKIIGGITRGLLYLHEDSRLRIIHRDLKASNILLDKDMNAKIADFGLARSFGVDQTQGNTNKVAGTLGYMSPEYAMHGHFSVKSDVFSFGVIVLEIIFGRRNSSFYQENDVEDLLRFAWKQWTGGRTLELLDSILAQSPYSEIEVVRCINIGLLCVQEDADARPSMASILNMLNNNSVTLPEPKKPPYFISKGIAIDISGDAENLIPAVISVNNSSITEVHPR